jgi:hypothetical protein
MLNKIASLCYAAGDFIGGLSSRAIRETNQRAMNALSRLDEKADEYIKRREEQAKNYDPSLPLFAPDQWRSVFYMPQGFRVNKTESQSSDHWQGGPPRHQGAKCPHCKKPLLLFWDIDCRDERFKGQQEELFKGINRLPLYYCPQRPEPTTYQIVSNDRIRMFTPELLGWEESPFGDYPTEFSRQKIELESIPDEIFKLTLIANCISASLLSPTERAKLREYLGNDDDDDDDEEEEEEEDENYGLEPRFSQFGAIPLMGGEHRSHACPNPECETHRMKSPYVDNSRDVEMKQLAIIREDSGLEMEWNYATITFYICWRCLSVLGEYRSS